MNLLIEIDEKNPDCLYKQIVDGVCELVRKGALPRGGKLPSARDLAKSLAVSRWTVERAYEDLSRLRIIQVRPAVGTFVCSELPSDEPRDPTTRFDPAVVDNESDTERATFAARFSAYGETIVRSSSGESVANQFASIAPELLPFVRWQAALIKSSRTRQAFGTNRSSQLFGSEQLRAATADYLIRARNVRCNKEQIVLFPGTELPLEMLARLFINAGDSVAVEDPGFPAARRVFSSQGARLIGIPVDAEGMQAERLVTMEEKPKLIVISPSRHDPTGVAMSERRRKLLLEWAAANGSYIIEDDFDNEYQYGRAAQSLQGMDRRDVVIYLSSFFKALYPMIHIGFLVIPPPLVPIMRRAKTLIELDFHSLEQDALAGWIRDGGFERHIRQTKRVLAARRATLVRQVHQHLSGLARIAPATGGTHLTARFDRQCGSDAHIMQAADSAGLPLMPTHSYYLQQPVQGEFLLSFALLEEGESAEAVEKFARALRGSAGDAMRNAESIISLRTPFSVGVNPA